MPRRNHQKVLAALESDRWRAAGVRGDDVEVRETAIGAIEDDPHGCRALAETLTAMGCSDGDICLGLPADWVLAAQIECDGLPRKDRRTAMLYRLEEQLPLEAERLTVDFLPAVAGKALGLAVETAKVAAVIESLAAAEIEVMRIVPTALLTLWTALASDGEQADYVMISDAGRVDVLRLREGIPAAWYTAADDVETIGRCLAADMLASPVTRNPAVLRVIAGGPWNTGDAIARDLGVDLQDVPPVDPLYAAARTADRLLGGREAGWVNFRQGALAATSPWARFSGALRAAAAAALVLLCCVSGLFWWRGHQCETAIAAARRMQEAVYARLYPNQPAPLGIKRRLLSESRRLAGSRGADVSLPDQPCALKALRRVFAGLPPQMRLRIHEIQVHPTRLIIEGQTRTHSDAEIIQRALAQAGLDVRPPHTENLTDRGVAFTLIGKTGPSPRADESAGGPS